MAITEKQIVRVIPSRLASFPPEQSRFLDRRKGMVEEIYVPFGERKAKARVRWFPKGINDREREMILLLEDLELAI